MGKSVEDFSISQISHDRAEIEFIGVTGVERYRVAVSKNVLDAQVNSVVRPAINNQFGDVLYQISFENLVPGTEYRVQVFSAKGDQEKMSQVKLFTTSVETTTQETTTVEQT